MRCLYDGEHPCGRCPACLANRQRGFMFRLDEEKENAKFYFWLTLQYDDDHVPRLEDGEMCFSKEHCHFFFEKLRKRYSKQGSTFKHFLVCEYGPEGTHRPHYHCLLMVYNKEDSKMNYLIRKEMRDFVIHEAWPHGHVTEKAFHGRVLRYLTKYCLKPELLGQHHTMKPFTLISRGIGLSLLDRIPEKQKQQMIERADFTYWYNGKKIQLPRYYVDKIAPHSKQDLIKASLIGLETGGWESYYYISDIRKRMQDRQNALNLASHRDILNISLSDLKATQHYYQQKQDHVDFEMSQFRAKCKSRKNL